MCTECLIPGSEEAREHPEEMFPFTYARCALSFEDAARSVVRMYKDNDEMQLDRVVASFICAAMRGRSMNSDCYLDNFSAAINKRVENGAFLPIFRGGVQKNPNSPASAIQNNQKSPDLIQKCPNQGCTDTLEGTKRRNTPKNVHSTPVNENYLNPQGNNSPFVRCHRRNKPAGAHPTINANDWTLWADALVYVPASPEAILRRGFDHMQRIAILCGKRTGLEVLSLLVSHKQTLDQRNLKRSERLANRKQSFALASNYEVLPQHVVLIDDVLTTGATLSAATQTLLNGGVKEVRVGTCCRVW